MRTKGRPVLGAAEIDRVIHEPARFVLMASLAVVDDADFVHLVRATGLSPGNAGAHLKKLAAAGYVTATKSFVDNRPQTVFSMTEHGRNALSAYARTVTALLAALPD
jgi:DNA-binding MarR family transcriptional regulator